jgi:integrase
VRVVRGPRDDGRWYWRADRAVGESKRENVITLWGTRDEVEAAVVAYVAQRDPAAAVTDGQIVTVLDLVECWLAAQLARNDIRPHSKRFSRGAARRIASSDLRRVRLDRLDRSALERHRDAELRRGAGPTTLRRDLAVLRQAWRWASEIGQAPARELPRVRIQSRDRVYTHYTPSRAEIGRVLELEGPKWVIRCVMLLATTGARIGEIVALTWEQVAEDGSRLWVDGKTGRREILLHPTMTAEVVTWSRGGSDEPIFDVNPGVAANRVNRWLAKASRELGLPRLSANGLRRAMTDALYRSGAGVDIEAALLGHAPKTALEHYRRVADEDLLRAIIHAGVGLPNPSGTVIELPTRREG